MPDDDERSTPVPESKRRPPRRLHVSLVWIVPIVAAAVGAWVAFTEILGEGPEITIVLSTAEGLEAGKSTIQYNGVQVGKLTEIRLSDDHERVIATAQMASGTDDFLVEGTQFWVVRPRISGSTVSGLRTLISGAYIGMEIGDSDRRKRTFVALDTPPVVSGDTPGRFFRLTAPDLGSLDFGTPIYFRRLEVGQVAAYSLAEDGRSLSIRVFVKAPYDRFVNESTRFWEASGIDLTLDASGLTLDTESLLSILIGGIAFETPETASPTTAAEADAVFKLYEDRRQAFLPVRGKPETYQLVFEQSVRGLARGAPVELRGIQIGEVMSLRAQVDTDPLDVSIPVTVNVYPELIGSSGERAAADEAAWRSRVDALVANGLRGELRSGSLLTGALFVAFDFFPDAPPARVDWTHEPPRLPTAPGGLQAIEARVESILEKIDQVPFKEIGDELRDAIAELEKTLAGARKTLTSAQGTLDDVGKLVAPSSLLGTELVDALSELSRAARSLRVLADYLERHPEALLRGKTGEAK